MESHASRCLAALRSNDPAISRQPTTPLILTGAVGRRRSMQDGRSPKRRRMTPDSEPSSSPDELSATPFDKTKLYKVKTPASSAAKRYSYSGPAEDDESPDELENDVHAFYRGRSQAKLTDRGRVNTADTDARAGRSSQKESDRAARGYDDYSNNFNGRGRDDYHGNGSNNNNNDDDEDDDDESMHTPPSRMSSPAGTNDSIGDEDEDDDEALEPPPPPPKLTPQEKWRPYRLKMVLEGHRRGVAQVKISPDGKKIASCSADATIRIWDAASGRQLHAMQGHLAGISTIAWSPDSETLASGSDDKSIRLWNTETGKPYPTPLLGHHNYVYAIAFSPKGNMIVSGSYDEAVFIWDVRGARVMRSLPAHSDPVGGVDFVRDGTLVVSCAGDGLIRIWDTMTGQCLRTLVQGDREPVTSVVFSPNGKYVLAWTLDSCLRLWDYVDGRCVKTYQGHKNAKYSIGGSFGVYGPEKTDVFVASASEDGRVLFWDITTKEILQTIDAHEGVVLGFDCLLETGLSVSCGIDGKVKVWELEEASPVSNNAEVTNDAMDAMDVMEEL